MKKAMILFSMVLMFNILQSCSGDSDLKQTWVFTVTTVMSSSPAQEGFPMTATQTIEQSNLTEGEAKDAADAMKATSSITMGGYTITTSISAAYAVKK